MLRDLNSPSLRLTATELAALRTKAAQNGYVVDRVTNDAEHFEALVVAANPRSLGILDDLLEFLETGSSPLTRGETDFATLCDKP